MRRRMSVVVRDGDNRIFWFASAQSRNCCRFASRPMIRALWLPDGVVPFTPDMRKEVRRITRKLNQDGLRALAVAY